MAELREPERLPDELDDEELVDLPGRRVLLLPLGVVVHEGRDDLPGGGLEPLQQQQPGSGQGCRMLWSRLEDVRVNTGGCIGQVWRML